MSGIFGIASKQDNCIDTLVLGTHYLQHRAQDYCGAALHNGGGFSHKTHSGEIQLDPKKYPEKSLFGLKGNMGIGCVSGERQPVSELSGSQGIVMAFDGNIVNHTELRDQILRGGETFSGYSTPGGISKSVLISKIIARELTFADGIESLAGNMKGDFAIVALAEDGVYTARGWGRKPLILGKRNDSYAVASESVAFENTGFEIVRDVEPGEVVKLTPEGIDTIRKLDLGPVKYGTFEWVYTAYPPSIIDGRSVSEARKAIWTIMIDEIKKRVGDIDVVSPIPNSGKWHAVGVSHALAMPYEEVFIRYEYSGRSFTPQTQAERDREAEIKLIPMRAVIKGKKIIVVDDSIVRGTQMENRVRVLKDLGAEEVHALIACPPLMHACLYGDTTKKDEDCIARRMPVGKIKELFRLDSLTYATVEALEQGIQKPRDELCLECWVK